MIQTALDYLKQNYGIGPTEPVLMALTTDMVSAEALADRRAEFVCDCIYNATRYETKFRDALASAAFAGLGPAAGKQLYDAITGSVAETVCGDVASVWTSRNELPFPKLAAPGIRKYLLMTGIPSDTPWTVVELCQRRPELAKRLRDAYAGRQWFGRARRDAYIDETLELLRGELAKADAYFALMRKILFH